jgi:hypothetical protein
MSCAFHLNGNNILACAHNKIHLVMRSCSPIGQIKTSHGVRLKRLKFQEYKVLKIISKYLASPRNSCNSAQRVGDSNIEKIELRRGDRFSLLTVLKWQQHVCNQSINQDLHIRTQDFSAHANNTRKTFKVDLMARYTSRVAIQIPNYCRLALAQTVWKRKILSAP